jgi:hypothetical protein
MADTPFIQPTITTVVYSALPFPGSRKILLDQKGWAKRHRATIEKNREVDGRASVFITKL